MDKIRKGSLVIFKNAFGEPILNDDEIMKAFIEIFGNFGIVISDIYEDEEVGLVVDIWYSKDVKFFAIPISRLLVMKPS